MGGKLHILIDGFNVIHAWPELKAALRYGYEAACEQLVEKVRILHDAEGHRVTVVFDGNQDTMTIDRPGKELTFSVVYAAAGDSADGVIEKVVCNSKGNPVSVVTNDLSIGNIARSQGANVVTPFDLIQWIDTLLVRQRRYLQQGKNKGMRYF